MDDLEEYEDAVEEAKNFMADVEAGVSRSDALAIVRRIRAAAARMLLKMEEVDNDRDD